MIQGVEFKTLITHTDERGFFREMIRNTGSITEAGLDQVSHSLVYQGVIKAWHYHKIQTQWNYVISGLIKVVLYDLREESPTVNNKIEFFAGDNQEPLIYCFPPGVAHGYKCLNGPMNIIYITSGIYDPEEEGRLEYDNRKIGYDWLKLEIK
ncbi:MAG TPA: dTDP-4-dehydrorhamnose 3,5-epimerase family protein [Bacteroidales bacterium]|nr:dTDP-4-dehydrorhamnose 3,5-epimerase family protein [Bacteroidales bacterium]